LKKLPFEEVSRKFIDYSRMFPEQIIEKSTEIQDIEQDIINIFNEDLSKIKKIINDTHLRIRINYKRFADPVYLLLNSLYTDESLQRVSRPLSGFGWLIYTYRKRYW
jgi:hypothetical protein